MFELKKFARTAFATCAALVSVSVTSVTAHDSEAGAHDHDHEHKHLDISNDPEAQARLRAVQAKLGMAEMLSDISFDEPFSADDLDVGARNGVTIRVLFCRVNFPDDLTEYSTAEEAEAMMHEVNEWFREASYGLVNVETVVTPLLTMPHSWRWYDEFPPYDEEDSGVSILTTHAMEAAEAAGLSHRQASIVTVRHRSGMFGGWGGLGAGGMTWLKTNSVGVQIHEMGHALGLPHAAFWDTRNRGTLGARDAADGFKWNNHVQPYGEQWDVMGNNDDHDFLPLFKIQLGWLRRAQVANAEEGNGRYRVYAFDYHHLDEGKQYALRVPRNFQQTYWAGIRYHDMANNADPFRAKSLLLWEKPWDSSREEEFNNGQSVPTLIDANPGTASGGTAGREEKLDAGIILGQTYSDWPADLHITVVDAVETTPVALDVVVNQGPFPDNNPPQVELTLPAEDLIFYSEVTDQVIIEALQEITFVANATDPDGDELAYFWNIDDRGANTENTSSMTRTFSESDTGLRTVRVTVSDMKGGTASASMRLNVGLQEFPGFDVDDEGGRSEVYMSGRVVDQVGNPVSDVRIWFEANNRDPEDEDRTITERFLAYSNTDGSWHLSGVDASLNDGVTFNMYKDGLLFAGLDNASPFGSSPIPLRHNDVDELNFVAYSRQIVTLETLVPEVNETNSSVTVPSVVRVRRTGATPVDQNENLGYSVPNFIFTDLWVRLYSDAFLAGDGFSPIKKKDDTATFSADYGSGSEPLRLLDDVDNIRNPEYLDQGRDKQTELINQDRWVRIPAGEEFIDIDMTVAGDTAYEGNRMVEIFVAYSPDYSEGSHSAKITIIEDEPVVPTVVTASVDGSTAWEGGQQPAVLHFLRSDQDLSEELTIEIELDLAESVALEGVDFAPFPRIFTFPVGQREYRLPIFAYNDNVIEGGERFVVTLGAATGFVWSNPAATLTLLVGDQTKPNVSVTTTRSPAREPIVDSEGAVLAGARNGEFTFSRSGDLNTSLTVEFEWVSTSDVGVDTLNSAELGPDFSSDAGVEIYFAPGVVTRTVTFEPGEDALNEGSEYAVVRIVPRTTYNVNYRPYAYAEIADTGTIPLVSLTNSNIGSVNEGQNRVFTLRRTTPLETIEEELIVYYSLSGDADPGFDYTLSTPVSGQVIFPAGETTVSIQLTAAADNQDEGTELVHLNLLRGNPAAPDSAETYAVDFGADNSVVQIRDIDPESDEPQVAFEELTSDLLEGESGLIFVELSRLPSSDDAWHTGGEFPQAHINIVTVDYEVLYDATPGANPATPDVDFDAYSSTDVTGSGVSNSDQAYHIVNGLGYPVVGGVSYDPNDFTTQQAYQNLHNNLRRDTNAVAVARGTLYFFYDRNNRLRRHPIEVDTLQDALPEGVETFMIRLSNPRNCSLPVVSEGEARYHEHIVRIHDDDTAGVVSLTASDAEADESGVNPGAFVLTRTDVADLDTTLSVHVEVLGGAAWGIDYLPIAGMDMITYDDSGRSLTGLVTFAPNQSEITLPVVVLDDDMIEAAEDVIMRIVSSFDYTRASPAIGSVVISDSRGDSDELPRVSLKGLDLRTVEGGEILLEVTRTGDLTSSLSVDLVFDPRSTISESEIDLKSIFFGPGEATFLRTINVLPDSEPEDTESLLIGLASSTNYVMGPDGISVRAYVFDDDGALPEVTVEATRPTFVEDSVSPAIVTVTRSRDEEMELTVQLNLSTSTGFSIADDVDVTVNGAAWAGEPLEFEEGEFEKLLIFNAFDDALQEGEESLTLAIAEDATYTISNALSEAVVTLIDDDFPTVSVSTLIETPIEGSSDAVFRVARTGGDQSLDLLVNLETSGVAEADDDFTALTSVTIPADSGSVDVALATIDDNDFEDHELLTLAIGASADYTIGTQGMADTLLLDNDKSRVYFSVQQSRAQEFDVLAAGPVNGVVRIHRVGDLSSDLLVGFTLGGTATNAVDYADLYNAGPGPAVVTIPAGDDFLDVNIVPIDDDLVENTESVVFTLLEDPGYTFGQASLDEETSVELNLFSEDVPTVIVEVVSSGTVYDPVTASATPAKLRFTRIGDTVGPLRVNYSVGGTASASVDFETLLGYVDMVDGQESAEVEVLATQLVPDTLTVELEVVDSLTRLGAYAPGNPVSGIVYILGVSAKTIGITRIDAGDFVYEGGVVYARLRVQRNRVGDTDLGESMSIQLSGSGEATFGGVSGNDFDLEKVLVDEEPAGGEVTSFAELGDVVFAADETARDILVRAVADDTLEGPESYTISIATDYVPDSELGETPYFLVGESFTFVVVETPDRLISIRIIDQNGEVVATYFPEVLAPDTAAIQEAGIGYEVSSQVTDDVRLDIVPNAAGNN